MMDVITGAILGLLTLSGWLVALAIRRKNHDATNQETARAMKEAEWEDSCTDLGVDDPMEDKIRRWKEDSCPPGIIPFALAPEDEMEALKVFGRHLVDFIDELVAEVCMLKEK